MPPKDPNTLPFVTRKQLAFEGGAQIQLQLTIASSLAGDVTIRGMTREGVFTFRHTSVGDDSQYTALFSIPDFPIMVSVVDTTGGFLQGECFASLELMVNGEVIYELCSGFVNGAKGISYPTSQIVEPIPGHGRIKVVAGSDPAANVEASITVPFGVIWRVIAVHVQLVTDANAANRRVHFVYSRSGGYDYHTWGNTDQAANTTKDYDVLKMGAIQSETDNGRIAIVQPQEIWLDYNSKIKTATTNRQVGDNFGAMDALVEEFFDVSI